MALRLCGLIVLCLVWTGFTYGAGSDAPTEKMGPSREIVCHCQFVELSPRAVEDFCAAADLVKERSRAKHVPDFGVCRRAQPAFEKLALTAFVRRHEWPPEVATNQRPARVMSGGEFPILAPAAQGRVVVQWKRFGRRGEVVPQWLESGRLQLDVVAEIASRDYSHAVTANGLTVPGLTTRRAHARVEMNLGETAVMNLGPELTFSDDDDLTPTKPDRPSASGTSVPAAAERAAKRETVALFLVTPTAATTSPVNREAK